MVGQVEPSGAGVLVIGDRLLGRVDDLAAELTDRIRSTEPFYGAGGVVPVEDLRSSVCDNLVHILNRLAGHPVPDLEPPRETGRRRAEQGVPLPVILHAYRIAGKFIWAAILAEAARDDGSATALLETASELWFIIDELSGEVTDSYRDTLTERARRDEQTRSAMLDVLLRGDPSDGSRLWECASGLRLPHRGTFVVAAARAARPGEEAVPRAEVTLNGRGIQSAWRVQVDAHVGVVVITSRHRIEQITTLLGELSGGPVGLSEPYPSLDQTPAALRQAHLACTAAAASGHGIARYEHVPIAILLASAPDAAAAVARTIIGAILELPTSECDMLLGTLRAWFADHGATSVAAAKLHVHRNTVRYRLRRVEELTGRSLAEPTSLAEIYLGLEAARILHLPGPERT